MCGVVCMKTFGNIKKRDSCLVVALTVNHSWEHFELLEARSMAEIDRYQSVIWDIYENANKSAMEFVNVERTSQEFNDLIDGDISLQNGKIVIEGGM